MLQKIKSRSALYKASTLLVLFLIAGALFTRVAYAQVGGLSIYTKTGDPTELVADGKSQTRLMFDLSGCVWYPAAGADDLLQVEITTSLGTSASPPSVNKTIVKAGSPFEVTLRAGSQTGTAKVTATASFCKEGNLMAYGTCSSIDEQNTPKCTGEFEITVLPAGSGGEEEESAEESEETDELSVSIACPSNPKMGESVSCTASVSGAQEGESLEYLWSLEGKAGSKTKDRTFTWKGEEIGYYEVSVEVFGQEDRSARKSLQVTVVESETSEEEEKTEESASSEVSSVSALTSSLESFLNSAGLSNIDPARLAVAGTGVSALIAIWMIVNYRSGVPKEKLEQALDQWRWPKGRQLPPSSPEVEKKTPEDSPKRLPEAEKIDKAANPPSSLPEEKGVDKGAQASASAQLDPIPDTAAAPPSAVKAASGETVEQRLERLVDDTEGYREAVDKTISEVKKIFERVPKEIKESELWKQKVAPKLKKLNDLGIGSKSGKLKEFLRITKELLEVRKKVDADLSYLSREEREGVVWLERGLQGGEEVIKKIHQQFITDPAIAAAKWGLPKEQAAAVEKFLKQHQADFEKMLKGIKKLPRKFVEYGTKAQQRNQDVPKIKKMLYKRTNVEQFDWTKSPKKFLPAIKKIGEAASWTKKQLGRVFISLRDTRPRQE